MKSFGLPSEGMVLLDKKPDIRLTGHQMEVVYMDANNPLPDRQYYGRVQLVELLFLRSCSTVLVLYRQRAGQLQARRQQYPGIPRRAADDPVRAGWFARPGPLLHGDSAPDAWGGGAGGSQQRGQRQRGAERGDVLLPSAVRRGLMPGVQHWILS